MSYYYRWGLVIGQPPFQRFLRENYALGLADLKLLKRKSPFSQSDFSCLLCGVGNAKTARSFIEFVIERNPKARIVIIDLGTEQIAAVKKLVRQSFKAYDIEVRQINALDLTTWLKPASFDWIETDGFLELFSPVQLRELLKIWHTLLKKVGYISIREPASNSPMGSILDICRVRIGWWWLKIMVYRYTLADLEKLFIQSGFLFVTFPTKVPTFRRFTMVKTTIVSSQAD